MTDTNADQLVSGKVKDIQYNVELCYKSAPD